MHLVFEKIAILEAVLVMMGAKELMFLFFICFNSKHKTDYSAAYCENGF